MVAKVARRRLVMDEFRRAKAMQATGGDAECSAARRVFVPPPLPCLVPHFSSYLGLRAPHGLFFACLFFACFSVVLICPRSLLSIPRCSRPPGYYAIHGAVGTSHRESWVVAVTTMAASALVRAASKTGRPGTTPPSQPASTLLCPGRQRTGAGRCLDSLERLVGL